MTVKYHRDSELAEFFEEEEIKSAFDALSEQIIKPVFAEVTEKIEKIHDRETKNDYVNVRITPSVGAIVRELADENGMSVSKYLGVVVESFVEKILQERKNAAVSK